MLLSRVLYLANAIGTRGPGTIYMLIMSLRWSTDT